MDRLNLFLWGVALGVPIGVLVYKGAFRHWRFRSWCDAQAWWAFSVAACRARVWAWQWGRADMANIPRRAVMLNADAPTWTEAAIAGFHEIGHIAARARYPTSARLIAGRLVVASREDMALVCGAEGVAWDWAMAHMPAWMRPAAERQRQDSLRTYWDAWVRMQ